MVSVETIMWKKGLKMNMIVMLFKDFTVENGQLPELAIGISKKPL
jgi:hypothetical protein